MPLERSKAVRQANLRCQRPTEAEWDLTRTSSHGSLPLLLRRGLREETPRDREPLYWCLFSGLLLLAMLAALYLPDYLKGTP